MQSANADCRRNWTSKPRSPNPEPNILSSEARLELIEYASVHSMMGSRRQPSVSDDLAAKRADSQCQFLSANVAKAASLVQCRGW